MARKSKYAEQQEQSDQLEEETFFLTEDEFEKEWEKNIETKPKQKGLVRLIAKGRIVIYYKENEKTLGTSIQYNPDIHSNLKVGDEIDVP